MQEDLRSKAITFAKAHKLAIARELTDVSRFTPDEQPISVFMAGSPGAGKTEFSEELVRLLEEDGDRRIVRIDGDELRSRMPGYTGGNSEYFQGAVSLVVEKVHDLVLRNKQSFILDGTFSKYGKAADNIRRSLDRGRSVFIVYVYQTPRTAWRFTEARERDEGRNIPKSAFIEQFCGAKQTVERIHEEFGNKVTIFLVKKDFDTSETREVVELVDPKASIDAYIGERYTKGQLTKML